MFGGCVGEAVVELLVDVSLDGGDLFLLGGLEAEGCSKRFETETERQRQRQRLEAKRPCVNADIRNSRLAKGSQATSKV